MKYILMDYVQEAGWHALTRADQEHWLGAYKAFMEAMAQAGVLKSAHGLESASDASARRALCRLEGANRRFSHHRSAGSGRGAFVGGAVAYRVAWGRRGSARSGRHVPDQGYRAVSGRNCRVAEIGADEKSTRVQLRFSRWKFRRREGRHKLGS